MKQKSLTMYVVDFTWKIISVDTCTHSHLLQNLGLTTEAIVYLSGILTSWNLVVEFTDSINVSRLRNLITQPTNIGSFFLEYYPHRYTNNDILLIFSMYHSAKDIQSQILQRVNDFSITKLKKRKSNYNSKFINMDLRHGSFIFAKTYSDLKLRSTFENVLTGFNLI